MSVTHGGASRGRRGKGGGVKSEKGSKHEPGARKLRAFEGSFTTWHPQPCRFADAWLASPKSGVCVAVSCHREAGGREGRGEGGGMSTQRAFLRLTAEDAKRENERTKRKTKRL